MVLWMNGIKYEMIRNEIDYIKGTQLFKYTEIVHILLTVKAPAMRQAHMNHAASRRRMIFQRAIVSTATS